jgi:hypothetical protein
MSEDSSAVYILGNFNRMYKKMRDPGKFEHTFLFTTMGVPKPTGGILLAMIIKHGTVILFYL